MNIAEMHVWFRQYAQQMGMQNVRAILPEQIDNLINTATLDTVDEVINRNVGTTNDRVITDNAKLASVNALRTLYRVNTVKISSSIVTFYANTPIVLDKDTLPEALYFVDFAINYTSFDTSSDIASITNKKNGLVNYPNTSAYKTSDWLDIEDNVLNGIEEFNTVLQTIFNKYNIGGDSYKISDPSSKNTFETVSIPKIISSTKYVVNTLMDLGKTRWFPVRIVDNAYLADILNDWVLAPRLRTPVLVLYGEDNTESDAQVSSTYGELYLGENDSATMKSVAGKLYINTIRCSYIKTPAKVRYATDLNGTNVDSDLPEQLQIPMLKHAVDLYRASINGGMLAQQGQDQNQQREIARNTAVPSNGYNQ